MVTFKSALPVETIADHCARLMVLYHTQRGTHLAAKRYDQEALDKVELFTEPYRSDDGPWWELDSSNNNKLDIMVGHGAYRVRVRYPVPEKREFFLKALQDWPGAFDVKGD